MGYRLYYSKVASRIFGVKQLTNGLQSLIRTPVILNVINKQHTVKQLSKLKIGDIGVVSSFTDDKVSTKLMEMGCLPGEVVKVINIAPLGDPMAIHVAGYELSLRLDEAACVWVIENPPIEYIHLN